MIEFSPAALSKWQSLHSEQADSEQRLRLYIEGKGCDGFFYGLSFDTPKDSDQRHQISDSLELIIDPDTAIFCKNVWIEWVDDERGQGFLVNNRDQKKFRGKFYKRKAWQDVLTSKDSGAES